MKKTVCNENMCNGCMACVDKCPENAITIVDTMCSYNAVIRAEHCLQCGICRAICPNINEMDDYLPETWYQGWADDKRLRCEASSGGAASAIAESFVERGGVACSCEFKNGEFTFGFAEDKESLKKFTGSKYVKSNPKGIYKKIQGLLEDGKDVLFIGLPCQAAAVKRVIPEKLQKGLYIADIICHGTPSPKVLELFLRQYRYSLGGISDISFREKGYGGQCNRRIRQSGVVDSYMIAYLNSLSFTENCYRCQYADVKRISDITLGDSWGSELSDSEKRKGISLILCQNEKGKRLVRDTGMHLEMVDCEKAVLYNRQLRKASEKPEKRKVFFELLAKEYHFNDAVKKCLPKEWKKQELKAFLLKRKIYRNRNTIKYGIAVEEGDETTIFDK